MSKLYIVPTPIGNLEDITFRAVKVLQLVDFILAEDTRKARILLNFYKIKKRCISYHKFNEHKIINKLIPIIQTSNVALISEAGTPGISDPGYLIINKCIENNIAIETLPGPTAFLPALVNSGFPIETFYFAGFLPNKKKRLHKLNYIKNIKQTTVLYESPHRLLQTLKQIEIIFGSDHKIYVGREITKIHEENIRGSVAEVIKYYSSKSIKGEFVIVLSR